MQKSNFCTIVPTIKTVLLGYLKYLLLCYVLTAISAAFLAILPKLIVAFTFPLLSGSKCLDMICENTPPTPQNNKKSIKNTSTARAGSGSLVLWNIDWNIESWCVV